MMNAPRTTVLFDNLGPYHVARLASASKVLPVHAVEFSGRSADYAWEAPDAAGIRRSTVHPDGPAHQLSTGGFRKRLRQLLVESQPDVVAIPGWSGRGAFVAMEWALEQRIPYFLMSESTALDEPRIAWKEAVKSRFVAGAAAALVGGSPHADYLSSLGMPPSRIFTGYDVVDNDAFRKGSDHWRNHQDPDATRVHPYFLASCRFVPKKNLSCLLDAHAAQVSHAARQSGQPPWDLCLLGDGELKPDLLLRAGHLGIEVLHAAPWECPPPDHSRGRLLLPGFRQIHELFRFYAGAGAFVHASVTEQWGLVVNEAMASGLPVAVSNRCGCARDLIEEGVNGWTFPPDSSDMLSDILMRLATMKPSARRRMGEEGEKRIASWGPDRFCEGMNRAVESATRLGAQPVPFGTRLILRGLILSGK